MLAPSRQLAGWHGRALEHAQGATTALSIRLSRQREHLFDLTQQLLPGVQDVPHRLALCGAFQRRVAALDRPRPARSGFGPAAGMRCPSRWDVTTDRALIGKSCVRNWRAVVRVR